MCNNGCGNSSCWVILIIILILCGGFSGCGSNNGCSNSGCGCSNDGCGC